MVICSTPIRKVAVLRGNRNITSNEREYFEQNGFKSESVIDFEFDFMDAIIQDKENIRKMLESSGIDQLKIDTGQEYQSNETLREGVTINECLKAYEQIEEIVRINTMHQLISRRLMGQLLTMLKTTMSQKRT